MNINKRYQAERELTQRLPADVMRHSQLAMRAARRMRASRQKDRHGKVICQHLLRMLACDTKPGAATVTRLVPQSIVSPIVGPIVGASAARKSAKRPLEAEAMQYCLGF